MLVVFEGIDGSGKTTVSNQVAQRLKGAGHKVKHLRADGKFASAVTEAIRALGRDARNLALVPEAEFLLYVARDVQLVEEALRPVLGEYDVVIADRFFYTADALARFGRGLSVEWTGPVLARAANGIEPDLVVLVDVDPKLARARRKSARIVSAESKAPSRKGLGGVGLQHRLRRGYLEMAGENPERWAVLDNTRDLERSVTRVTELIESTFHDGSALALHRFRETASQARALSAPTVTSPDDALRVLLEWVDDRADTEPRVAAYLLTGLYGPGVDARRKRLMDRAPEGVLAALSGLDDAVSWEIRDALSEHDPAAVIRSLSVRMDGSHARAMALRRAHQEDAADAVLRSVSGHDDDFSWELRERYIDEHGAAVLSSLRRLGSAAAWRLRERWLGAVGDAIDEAYDAAKVAAQSVAGLDDERAWALRKRVRAVAPVSVIASLKGLVSERSWRMRERYLIRAPKAVMGTLSTLDVPQAWAMRRMVADRCKEALDGIVGFDCAGAWELRDAYRDTWPSTVAKSLGGLADMARGRALLGRQLARYPADLSLLQHAAAVALGVHRDTVDSD